jgi:hypothetical protein
MEVSTSTQVVHDYELSTHGAVYWGLEGLQNRYTAPELTIEEMDAIEKRDKEQRRLRYFEDHPIRTRVIGWVFGRLLRGLDGKFN